MDDDTTVRALVAARNDAKLLFTAGPASLLAENLTGLRPCFGRDDADYARVESQVLDALTAMTGHRRIARMQGPATLALEVIALNFLCGRVAVVSTGFYSERLRALAESARRRTGAVASVDVVDWTEVGIASGRFDWIVACPTETSRALKLPIPALHALARRTGARLMLDATASIGLESGHDLADVVGYSSCKGLFGLTGAAFVAFNDPPEVEPDSFCLDLASHLERRMTGPYHAIASLLDVLPRHGDFRAAVVENKRIFMERMASRLTLPPEHQPLLCTHVDADVVADDPRAVLYRPRGTQRGSVVCHLGEAHLGRGARAGILDALRVVGP